MADKITITREYTKKEAFYRLLELLHNGVTASDYKDKDSELSILIKYLELEYIFT